MKLSRRSTSSIRHTAVACPVSCRAITRNRATLVQCGNSHVLGLPLTLFSIYGLVALSGVVVNDSIVLIDFINRRNKDGAALNEALLDAGRRRFRPVLLTSVTTIAGVLPILLETQRQALVLIPMATSLAFGLMLTTVLVLVLAPTFYLVSERARIAVSFSPECEEPLPLAVEQT